MWRVGFFWKKLVHNCNKRGVEGGKNLRNQLKRKVIFFSSKSVSLTYLRDKSNILDYLRDKSNILDRITQGGLDRTSLDYCC